MTRLLPWLVLVAMLGVTWGLWDHERQVSRKELHAQFEFALRDSVSRIGQAESAYEQMLRGLQALFATTDLTARDAVLGYVETLQIDANFSGIQEFSVIQWVPMARKPAHLAAMGRLGLPAYALLPAGGRDQYAPVIQSVPDLGGHREPLGQDAWADPVRRRAMEKARDSGLPAISDKLGAATGPGRGADPGFAMYLPVYARGGTLESIGQRRANLLGWVEASFGMNEFMASLDGKPERGISLSLFDGVSPGEASLLFQAGTPAGDGAGSRGSALSAREYMVLGGHTWTLCLRTEEPFEARFERNNDRVIAVIGICLSLSMALLVWYMIAGRAHALRLADAMTEQLRHMAQHDPLTGLPNRALFSDRVQQKLADARRRGGHVAMLFIDLDHFKQVNDSHGHSVGDLLLQQVAKRISESVRASDTVGRIGGDEFVAVIGNLPDADSALRIAEKIELSVAQPFRINELEFTVSCSMGIAVYPDDGSDEATLTKRADQAMYRAKGAGRNCMKRAEFP
jgi:diguanylate cyclase (GGDEF)-like protein